MGKVDASSPLSLTIAAPPDRYRQLFERNTAPQLVVRSVTGVIVEVNQAAADFYGRPRAVLAGTPISQLGAVGERDVEEALDVAASIGVHLAGVPQLVAGGERRLAEMYLSPLDEGDDPLVHVIVHDITERARAEDQARSLLAERVARAVGEEAAQEWQGTFDAIEQPILVADAAGRVTRANDAAGALTGITPLALIGRALESLGDPRLWSAAAAHVRVALEHGTMGIARVRDDAARTWEVSATRFHPAGGDGPRVIVVLREITELISLQDEVQRQETLSRMGELVAGVAHEVRNPLFALSSALDALRQRLGPHPDFARYAVHLDGQVERLSHLMRDLLDYGRPSALTLRDVPVGDLVGTTLELGRPGAAAAGVTLRAALPGLPATAVRADRHRLLLVLQNLVTNAVQHAPAGSAVTLAAATVGEGHVEFVVSDEGPGFAPDTIDRVFEPFFTKRPGGTGLGLALAHRTVHDHGGRITAENRRHPDGTVAGAVLRVRLPLATTTRPVPDHP